MPGRAVDLTLLNLEHSKTLPRWASVVPTRAGVNWQIFTYSMQGFTNTIPIAKDIGRPMQWAGLAQDIQLSYLADLGGLPFIV